MTHLNRRFVEAGCPQCAWCQSCNDAHMVAMLRSIRKLAVNKAPAGGILRELFRHSLPELECPKCGHQGLRVGAEVEADEDWQEVETRACDMCSRPIEPERLEAIPDAKTCVKCQRLSEEGNTEVEAEYCEKCGSPMVVVPSRGRGISRYVMRCSGNPPCR
jgi:Zn finger protein HypA/HybF involved in hydrogenase expression